MFIDVDKEKTTKIIFWYIFKRKNSPFHSQSAQKYIFIQWWWMNEWGKRIKISFCSININTRPVYPPKINPIPIYSIHTCIHTIVYIDDARDTMNCIAPRCSLRFALNEFINRESAHFNTRNLTSHVFVCVSIYTAKMKETRLENESRE